MRALEQAQLAHHPSNLQSLQGVHHQPQQPEQVQASTEGSVTPAQVTGGSIDNEGESAEATSIVQSEQPISQQLDDVDDDIGEPDAKRQRLATPEGPEVLDDEQAVLALAAHNGNPDSYSAE